MIAPPLPTTTLNCNENTSRNLGLTSHIGPKKAKSAFLTIIHKYRKVITGLKATLFDGLHICDSYGTILNIFK